MDMEAFQREECSMAAFRTEATWSGETVGKATSYRSEGLMKCAESVESKLMGMADRWKLYILLRKVGWRVKDLQWRVAGQLACAVKIRESV
nr:hypothetical protein Iba_chr03bCG13900 [Ipomoea batatas]GME13032.1 hypothetical protein Iba_scaffold14336CG0160 [Ipomoea batatas]